jgi:heme/copper-type cytochrome/quinol oxidase subunit 4
MAPETIVPFELTLASVLRESFEIITCLGLGVIFS